MATESNFFALLLISQDLSRCPYLKYRIVPAQVEWRQRYEPPQDGSRLGPVKVTRIPAISGQTAQQIEPVTVLLAEQTIELRERRCRMLLLHLLSRPIH